MVFEFYWIAVSILDWVFPIQIYRVYGEILHLGDENDEEKDEDEDLILLEEQWPHL